MARLVKNNSLWDRRDVRARGNLFLFIFIEYMVVCHGVFRGVENFCECEGLGVFAAVRRSLI